MKTAYSFIRWSSKRQSRESSDSKRRQTKSAQEWCQSNGYILSNQVFIGAAESGYSAEHLKVKDGIAIGALARFIEAVDKGLVKPQEVLCIDSVDRWGRQEILDALEPFTKLLNRGIGIVFTGTPLKELLTRELINKHPEKLQWLINEMTRSWAESAEKSRKIKEAKAAKKAEMQAGVIVTHNNIPKYFSFIPDNPDDDNIKTGKYVHNKQTPIIIELIDGALAGKSLYAMAKDLNDRNIPTIRRKFQWSGNSIGKILRNPILYGAYLGNENYVLKIIDKTKFLKLQNILNKNVFNRGKRAGLVNIFKGIAYCAECNGKMNVASGIYKGVAYRYIHCANYGKRDSCKEKAYLPLESMEHDFFYSFLAKNPHDMINGDEKTEIKELQDKIDDKTAELNLITADIQKLIRLMRGKAIDELEAEMLKLNSQRDDLKGQIDALAAKIAAIQDTPKNLGEVFLTTTHFGEGENGADIVKYTYADTLQEIEDALKDNKTRESIRVMLPMVIAKLVFDSKTRSFSVFNRRGYKLYQSRRFPSANNNTTRWRESLKTWTKRKVTGGRVIACKRK
jgi:hypothetical protein